MDVGGKYEFPVELSVVCGIVLVGPTVLAVVVVVGGPGTAEEVEIVLLFLSPFFETTIPTVMPMINSTRIRIPARMNHFHFDQKESDFFGK